MRIEGTTWSKPPLTSRKSEETFRPALCSGLVSFMRVVAASVVETPFMYPHW